MANKTGVPLGRFIDPAIDASGKGGFWKFVAGLNSLLNPGHAWTNYQDKPDSMVESWLHKETGVELTGAERQANAFSAAEAQKQRDWETEMSNTQYQRQVKDMQAAGINPAMAMNTSGASVPSGASASSVSPTGAGLSMSELMGLIMAPLQAKLMKSQAQQARDLGKAALINAGANVTNAETGQGNLDVNRQNAETARFNAETQRMATEVENDLRRMHIKVSESELDRIAAQTALLKLQHDQMPAQLAVAQKQADASQKQAIAALESAQAAVRNAAVNEKLSDSEIALRSAQEQMTWAEKEGKEIVNRYLDERQQRELENLQKEGVYLDARGRLVDKQGKLVGAQTFKTYVNSATDISGAINQWLNPFSKGAGFTGMSYESMNATIGLGGYD